MPEKNIDAEATMSIRATGASYIDAYSMYNELFTKNNKTDDTAANALGSYSSSSITSLASDSLFSSRGRESLATAIEAMKDAGYTRFTFSDIEKYRGELETNFSDTVKAGLEELGVDPDTDFSLVVDSSGKLSVVTKDSSDKAAIKKYFDDNPDLVDSYKNIQALSNLKKAQQKSSTDAAGYISGVKANLQAEAIQAFFAASDNNGSDFSSLISNFSSNSSTSYYLGLNQKV